MWNKAQPTVSVVHSKQEFWPQTFLFWDKSTKKRVDLKQKVLLRKNWHFTNYKPITVHNGTVTAAKQRDEPCKRKKKGPFHLVTSRDSI
jgi:hypothetical protein